MKINLGAGSNIYDGYINHDISMIPNIDVIHDLNVYPWPWANNSAEEIVANDLLEHLNDFMRAMEELYRIVKPGGTLKIKVPYWNSVFRYADPTHCRGFHEITFQFFDPRSPYCKERYYYTNARFYIVKENFVLAPFAPYFHIPGIKQIKISGKFSKRLVGLIGNIFSNVILDLELVLRKPDVTDNLGMYS